MVSGSRESGKSLQRSPSQTGLCGNRSVTSSARTPDRPANALFTYEAVEAVGLDSRLEPSAVRIFANEIRRETFSAPLAASWLEVLEATKMGDPSTDMSVSNLPPGDFYRRHDDLGPHKRCSKPDVGRKTSPSARAHRYMKAQRLGKRKY